MKAGSKKISSPNNSFSKSQKKIRSKAQKSAPLSQAKSLKSSELWPRGKNILFRPDRYKYVKSEKNSDHSQCVFCITAQATPSFDTLCVYKSTHAQIVMNKYPYNAGHLLILPLRHQGDLLDLTEDEMSEIYKLTRLAVKALRAEYQPQAFNIGMNMGAQAGAGIPDHLHYHVIPRWAGDTNFFPLIAETKVIIEDLSETYKKLQKHFDQK